MDQLRNTSGTHEFKNYDEMLEQYASQPNFIAASPEESLFLEVMRQDPSLVAVIMTVGDAEQVRNAGTFEASLETRLGNAAFGEKYSTEGL